MKINLYGGPGIGKSTTAALIFAELKLLGYNVEITHEYAKELVYEGINLTKADQAMQYRILMEQVRRELIFQNKVDFLISDSPLLLNAYYNGDPGAIHLARWNEKPKDLHFYLVRSHEHFESKGRSHSEKQSLSIDSNMQKFLEQNGVKLIEVSGSAHEKSKTIVEKALEVWNA